MLHRSFASLGLRAVLGLALSASVAACHHLPSDGEDAGVDMTSDDLAVGDLPAVVQISPQNPVIVIHAGQPVPLLLFTASLNGQPVAATWATDRPDLGAIPDSGLYTPAGTFGGKATIQATYMGQQATTSITVQYILVQNGDPMCGHVGTIGPGGYGGVGGNGPGCVATPAQLMAFQGTPTVDVNVKWLYPYDTTVFPRGLLAPLLMWDPATHNFDGMHLQMSNSSSTFSYDGTFAKPPGARFINLPIPQATWTSMNSSSPGEKVTIIVTFSEGAKTIGPIIFTWTISSGTLKGIVYYNSYGTSLVTNSQDLDASMTPAPFGAGTLGIKPGVTDPVLIAGNDSADRSGCRVCHSVTKDGAHLVTQRGDSYTTSRLVDLKNGNLETGITDGNSAFSALYPDGSLMFSCGNVQYTGATSNLYSLPSGDLIPTPTGLPADLAAAFPSFAADGTQLVFNWNGGVGSDNRSLAVMSFDVSTRTFGAITKITTPASTYPAVWPTFLPTNKAVVYEIEVTSNEFGTTRLGNQGELWWVDVATKQAHSLSKLNGVGYLPSSATHPDDTVLNYEPTVNPVPSGGYAWAVFTSRRLYGNVATIDPYMSDPRDYDWKNMITTKKLWVAAIDINGQPNTDPSHPAFYLPAQELYAGNSRGFWTVDPCLVDGSGCVSGDDCCGGYCQKVDDPDAGEVYECTSVKPLCSGEYEKCAFGTDCCIPGTPGAPVMVDPLACINGYCAISGPPIQ